MIQSLQCVLEAVIMNKMRLNDKFSIENPRKNKSTNFCKNFSLVVWSRSGLHRMLRQLHMQDIIAIYHKRSLMVNAL